MYNLYQRSFKINKFVPKNAKKHDFGFSIISGCSHIVMLPTVNRLAPVPNDLIIFFIILFDLVT